MKYSNIQFDRKLKFLSMIWHSRIIFFKEEKYNYNWDYGIKKKHKNRIIRIKSFKINQVTIKIVNFLYLT